MKIGIILVPINLWDTMTKPAIDSIKTKHDHLTIVVDNGSIDNTFHESQKLVGDQFAIIRNPKNYGVSVAWNQGVKLAFASGCDYVMVCNNDILFHPEAIDRLVDRFEAKRDVQHHKVNVPANVDMGNGETTGEGGPLDYITLEKENDIAMVTCCNIHNECANPTDIFTKDAEAYAKGTEGEHPDFSCFMINKHTYETIGEFDEGYYPAYHEDNDYHRRINLAGMRALNCPGAIYYHHGSATRNNLYRDRAWEGNVAFEKTKGYFVMKWGGMPEPGGEIGDRLLHIPFGDPKKTIKWTLQDRCKPGAICPHVPRCSDLYKRFGVDLSLI